MNKLIDTLVVGGLMSLPMIIIFVLWALENMPY